MSSRIFKLMQVDRETKKLLREQNRCWAEQNRIAREELKLDKESLRLEKAQKIQFNALLKKATGYVDQMLKPKPSLFAYPLPLGKRRRPRIQ